MSETEQNRTEQNKLFSLRSWLIVIVQTLSLTVVMLGILVICSLAVFGSIAEGRAWLTGVRVIVRQPEIRITFDPTDTSVKLRYEVSNLSGSPIAIFGSVNSCSCTMVGKLPDQIPPHGRVTVDAVVNIDPKHASGGIEGNIHLFTSHPRHSEIELKYFLRPSGASPSPVLNHVSLAE